MPVPSEEDQERLYNFGIQTGLLFQLRDDLLDTYGNTEVFGKKQFGDILANKKTFLYLKALEHTSGKDREKLSQLYADHSVDPDIKVKEVLKYFEDADVKRQTEEKIHEHYLLAREAFAAINVPEENKSILENYTEKLTGRSS